MKEARPRVFAVDMPGRPARTFTGAEGWMVLEELVRDAWAFAGVDAMAPMRRDVVRLVRRRKRS